MIKFDFSKYVKKLDVDFSKKDEYINKLYSSSMSGFVNNIISDNELKKIKEVAKEVRENSDVLIVIAIGESYLGSYAYKEMFTRKLSKDGVEVIYLGNSLSSSYLNEVISYIKDKDVSVNVISKSGNTLEIKLIYKIIKDELSKKYNKKELVKRIIITTDKKEGYLRKEVEENNYISFDIPKDIGGRYSLLTSAHLFPLSVLNYDIDEIVTGYKEGLTLTNEAYSYASIRYNMYHKKKYVENFIVYNDNMYYYTEWLKQLFAESEGKNKLGILPISTVNTRDLHSLGQFIQEGNNIIFETVIKVNKFNDYKYKDISLNSLNNKIGEAVSTAHYKEGIENIIIELDELNLRTISSLSSFFMLSAVFSSFMFNVDPFNQEGVEKYKNEIKKCINIDDILKDDFK